jgi:acyl-coenzyme A thioesterase PaaI-like protein
MHVQFLSALAGDDAIGEGWVVKRGRSTVFCEAEVVAASSGVVVARSLLT